MIEKRVACHLISGLYFIPEMLKFQKIPIDSTPSFATLTIQVGESTLEAASSIGPLLVLLSELSFVTITFSKNGGKILQDSGKGR